MSKTNYWELKGQKDTITQSELDTIINDIKRTLKADAVDVKGEITKSSTRYVDEGRAITEEGYRYAIFKMYRPTLIMRDVHLVLDNGGYIDHFGTEYRRGRDMVCMHFYFKVALKDWKKGYE